MRPNITISTPSPRCTRASWQPVVSTPPSRPRQRSATETLRLCWTVERLESAWREIFSLSGLASGARGMGCEDPCRSLVDPSVWQVSNVVGKGYSVWKSFCFRGGIVP
ncbi:hypothetical protein CTRI78_v008164 [Colletotrichum trifolii]|uniref:Uncharacterized protein n=1 Tax=Colletotrichum trifolii TaxID=5466 RepID=A0A4R8QX13_COLTR|nr:hypothetical protein CTRI78_v008164 [Colletotrichum trifolii]